MNKKVVLTFSNSQNDIPVLCVAEEGVRLCTTSATIYIDRFVTGDDAVRAWELIVGEKAMEKNETHLLLTFDNSQNDIPVLCVAEKVTQLFEPHTTIRVKRFITGDDAVKTWELIAGKKADSAEDRDYEGGQINDRGMY